MTFASRPFRRVAIACALSCLLTACAVGPDYVRPELPMPDQFLESGVVWQRVQPQHVAPSDAPWWRVWNDPELDRLLRQARTANPSIAAAESAWRQAQAALGQARAAGRPQVGVGVGQSRNENAAAVQGIGDPEDGRIREIAQAQLTASWELDLWGRVRRTVEAQGAQARASAHELAVQRLSIEATTASAYFSVRQMDVQLGLLTEQLQVNRRLLQMSEVALALGAASQDELAQARNAVEGSQSALEAARASRARSLHALAVLTGQAPASFQLDARPDYAFDAPLAPALVPSDLLLRRPDVLAAEARVEAANASIGIAQAAYFPSLGLSANGGYVGATVSDLFDAPLQVWSVGAQLAGSLFDGGARRSEKAQAQAGYEGAVADYRGAVLAAMQGVEDALSDYQALDRQARSATTVADNQHAIWQRKRHALELGSASERDALGETLNRLDAEQRQLEQQASLAQSAVSLFKEVGGSVPDDVGKTRNAAAGTAIR